MTEGARRGRLSRGRWIGAALDALVADGIEGVRIDRLCRDLGVTKGSFYHHFAGREDLLEAMADYWEATQPQDTAGVVARAEGDPMQQLVEITRLVADRDIGRRDHAMRAWAAADERAARSVQAADRQVLGLLEKILASFGVPAEEVHPLARVLFFTALGAHDAPMLFDSRSQRSLSRYLLRLVRERAGRGRGEAR
ncbi:MAG: TetR/AcrR family transcriptional regulator [Myxococcota bacterium]